MLYSKVDMLMLHEPIEKHWRESWIGEQQFTTKPQHLNHFISACPGMETRFLEVSQPAMTDTQTLEEDPVGHVGC